MQRPGFPDAYKPLSKGQLCGDFQAFVAELLMYSQEVTKKIKVAPYATDKSEGHLFWQKKSTFIPVMPACQRGFDLQSVASTWGSDWYVLAEMALEAFWRRVLR